MSETRYHSCSFVGLLQAIFTRCLEIGFRRIQLRQHWCAKPFPIGRASAPNFGYELIDCIATGPKRANSACKLMTNPIWEHTKSINFRFKQVPSQPGDSVAAEIFQLQLHQKICITFEKGFQVVDRVTKILVCRIYFGAKVSSKCLAVPPSGQPVRDPTRYRNCKGNQAGCEAAYSRRPRSLISTAHFQSCNVVGGGCRNLRFEHA